MNNSGICSFYNLTGWRKQNCDYEHTKAEVGLQAKYWNGYNNQMLQGAFVELNLFGSPYLPEKMQHTVLQTMQHTVLQTSEQEFV